MQEDQRDLGGPKSWRTKKLNSRRSLGDQTTWGTNKIQEKNTVGQQEFILVKWLRVKIKSTHLWCALHMSKFSRFLRWPNGPKICARRTKTDFKDRALMYYSPGQQARTKWEGGVPLIQLLHAPPSCERKYLPLILSTQINHELEKKLSPFWMPYLLFFEYWPNWMRKVTVTEKLSANPLGQL